MCSIPVESMESPGPHTKHRSDHQSRIPQGRSTYSGERHTGRNGATPIMVEDPSARSQKSLKKRIAGTLKSNIKKASLEILEEKKAKNGSSCSCYLFSGITVVPLVLESLLPSYPLPFTSMMLVLPVALLTFVGLFGFPPAEAVDPPPTGPPTCAFSLSFDSLSFSFLVFGGWLNMALSAAFWSALLSPFFDALFASSWAARPFHLRQPSKSIRACMQPHSVTLRSIQTKLTGCIWVS